MSWRDWDPWDPDWYIEDDDKRRLLLQVVRTMAIVFVVGVVDESFLHLGLHLLVFLVLGTRLLYKAWRAIRWRD